MPCPYDFDFDCPYLPYLPYPCQVRHRPVVAILPMLLLVAMLVAGIAVVEVEARKDRENVRAKV